MSGQKIKDTRAPLTGFGKFVVLHGVPKNVTNSRVNWLTLYAVVPQDIRKEQERAARSVMIYDGGHGRGSR